MSEKNINKVGKLIINSSEQFLKETFNKISNKVDSFKELSETEREIVQFGLDAYEYFEQIDQIPPELEDKFLSLKRRIDKLEKK